MSPGPAAAGGGPDPDPGAWPSYWRSLGYFSLARLVVAAALIGYVPLLQGTAGLDETFDSQLYLPVAVAYLAAAALFVVVSRPGLVQLRRLASLQIAVDLIALSVLIHAVGGARSGLAVLLILPNAGAAILTDRRVALFFAAVSTLVLLFDTGFRLLLGEVTESAFLPAGLIGAALFATVVIVNRLALRLEVQERLAWQRGEDLRNQLAVTQAVISELQDGVVVLGDRGELRAINRSAREMLGGAADPTSLVPGLLPLRAALGVRSPSAGSEALPQVAPGQVVEFTLASGAQDADRRLRARRLGGPAGVSDAVVVLEDLGRLEDRAQQLKLASMGRLSASIAHEIRNPLAAIRHANGLLAEAQAEAGNRRLAAIVEDNCVRINRIIEDVLSIARRGSAAPEPLPAARFLEQTVAEYLAQAGGDPRRVECRVLLEEPIWFDAGHLRQVLLNLLGNALRHASERAGAVRVEWESDASGRPVLAVSDDGPGVPPASRMHLFEPFFTTEARGTGLGLHLARELCTANAATIRYRPASDHPPLRSAFVVEPTQPSRPPTR